MAEVAVAGADHTIAQGHHTPHVHGTQAVTDAATYDARVAYYTSLHLPDTDARDWADLPIPTEGGAAWVEHDFTAAQTQEWLSATFAGLFSPNHPYQDQERLTAGLVDRASSAAEWRAVGVTNPTDALTWEINGLGPDEAAEWLTTGIPVREAVLWYQNGIEAKDAPHWRQAGFHQTDTSWWSSEYAPDQAREWADAGVIDGSTAKGWEQRDFTPDETRLWIAAGCDCAETAGAYVDELADIPREHTLSAYQCGYTVTEAAALDWDDPNVVAGLRTIGALKAGIASSPAA